MAAVAASVAVAALVGVLTPVAVVGAAVITSRRDLEIVLEARRSIANGAPLKF
jgi:hypothetical protein